MTVTTYIWDELTDNVIMESDDEGNVTEYTHVPELHGRVLSQRRNGVPSYFHYDGQGNVRQVTNSAGNVTDEMTYTAFGETVAKTGSTVNPWGYKGAMGYYTNPTTDDLYVRARTLEPSLGRWISEDPIGFVDGPNLYLYVWNQPLSYSDPSGLGCCCEKIFVRKTGQALERTTNGPTGWELGYSKGVNPNGSTWFTFSFVTCYSIKGNIEDCELRKQIVSRSRLASFPPGFELKRGTPERPESDAGTGLPNGRFLPDETPPGSSSARKLVAPTTICIQDDAGQPRMFNNFYPAYFNADWIATCIGSDETKLVLDFSLKMKFNQPPTETKTQPDPWWGSSDDLTASQEITLEDLIKGSSPIGNKSVAASCDDDC